MASWCSLAVFWIGALAVVGAGEDAPSDEVKKLEGTWVVTSATQDGKALVEMKDAQMTFTAKELTIQSKFVGKLNLPIKVDPTEKPNAIDLRFPGGEGWLRIDGVRKGIYELDRDNLKLCITDDKRPTKFSDKGAALIVLKRQK